VNTRREVQNANSEQRTANSEIGIAGLGAYAPPQIVTSRQLAGETGIPADVLREKFGVDQVHRAGEKCHVSDMATAAGSAALSDAAVTPDEIDLVVYCGSEYKDYIVWSAATHIAGLLGCSRAEAYEVYALCAGTPIALRLVKDMMLSEPDIRTALIVAASKESALVNRSNDRTRFMANFGDGAGAAVIRRDCDRNRLLGSASLVDSGLSMATIMPAGGSRRPAQNAGGDDHFLDVPDLDTMRDRLDEVSGANFQRVAHQALERSGADHVDVLVPVHVKQSMHSRLQSDLGAERAIYLREYGHMQAADQLVGLLKSRDEGLLREGDIVLLLAAGVGYTWSASVLRWGNAD
jgi:3-oxoacyl-[acyl-carrier-protein] synthase III